MTTSEDAGIPQGAHRRHHVYPELAAAGLWTTVGDRATANVELLRVLDGATPVLGLTRQSVRAMLAPQLPGQPPDGNHFGLGLYWSGSGAGRTFGHDGGNEGFLARLRLNPTTGCGVAIMINANNATPFLDEIERTVFAAYEGCARAAEKPPRPSRRTLAALCGCYRTSAGQQLVVSLSQGALALTVGQQPALRLMPTSATTFEAKAVNASVRFDAAERALHLTQEWQTQVGTMQSR